MASSPLPSDSATPSVPIEWAAAALALAIIFDLSGTMLLKGEFQEVFFLFFVVFFVLEWCVRQRR